MSAPGKPAVSELERRLDVGFHLPRLRVVGIAVAVAATCGLLAWPLASSARRSGTSSGPVTNHHRLIERACSRCHDAAFSAVPDRACTTCHAVRDHASGAVGMGSARSELGASCASCHKEHHGEESLVPRRSALCTSCHAARDELSDFAHHPELAVVAFGGTPPVLHRARLDEPDLHDASHLKFSHAQHLSQFASNGEAAVACASCHELGPDGRTIAPIAYARHCASCHRVAFDDRLPLRFVPHGDLDRARAFVAAEVAQWHVAHAPQLAGTKLRDLVARDREDDEIGLFTRGGGCFKCHDIDGDAPGNFAVQPVNLAARWMPAAEFSHASHRREPCDSCHPGVRDSTSGRDVMLPRIAKCRECHADPGTRGKLESPCLACHRYHALGPPSRLSRLSASP